MQDRLITVTGKGSVYVTPDVTRLELTLQSIHPTYEAAYGQTKADTDRLAGIMSEIGLDSSLPKTTHLDIDKKMKSEYDKNGHYKCEKFVGFLVNHKIKIDLGMDNVLLNKLLKMIGQKLKQAEIRIGYTVKDVRPSQLKMLERAVNDAKAKAAVMVAACGCSLGDVKSIDYSVQELHIYSPARSIHGCDDAMSCNVESLDITPDDLMVSDEVTVVWYLTRAMTE